MSTIHVLDLYGIVMLCSLKISKKNSKFSFHHPPNELSRIVDYYIYLFCFVVGSNLPFFSEANLVG